MPGFTFREIDGKNINIDWLVKERDHLDKI